MKNSVLIPAVAGAAIIVQWPSTFWWTCAVVFAVAFVLEGVSVVVGNPHEK